MDAGNKAIRLLRDVQDFDATQTVETVRLQSTEPLEPMGLALVSHSLLAISEDRQRRVRIAHLDDTHISGLLLSALTWDGLVAPRGLAALNGSLFIADSTRVLAVGVGSGDGAGGRVPALRPLPCGAAARRSCRRRRSLMHAPSPLAPMPLWHRIARRSA